MARNYVFAPGEYYHVYNRGVDKRKIFNNKKDYERFQFLLYICNNKERVHVQDYRGRTSIELFNLERAETLVDIGAYCLMPNHFHILVKEKEEGGISKFIQKLSTAYTMYFNKVNERSGVLFQGKFKAQSVDNDRHLKYLYSYITLNPLKIVCPNWKESVEGNHKTYLDSYKYSSFLDLNGVQRIEKAILKPSVFPEYFSEPKEFESFIKDWISIKSEQNIEVRPR